MAAAAAASGMTLGKDITGLDTSSRNMNGTAIPTPFTNLGPNDSHAAGVGPTARVSVDSVLILFCSLCVIFCEWEYVLYCYTSATVIHHYFWCPLLISHLLYTQLSLPSHTPYLRSALRHYLSLRVGLRAGSVTVAALLHRLK